MTPTYTTEGTALPTRVDMFLGRHCAVVGCGEHVARGQRIARATRPGYGDLHAPVAGNVERVGRFSIRIAVNGEDGESVRSADIEARMNDGLTGAELLSGLRALGADLPEPDVQGYRMLIVNGLDEEPDVSSRGALLDTQQAVIAKGMRVLGQAYGIADRVLVAAPLQAGFSETDFDGGTVHRLQADYPGTLDPLVALAVTGRENPPGVLVVGVETAFQVGTIAETGLPAAQVMLTVNGENRMVTLGTPVGKVLEAAGLKVSDGDRVVLGGVLRGRAAVSLTQGVDRETAAVLVVPESGQGPVAEDAACVGCGACVRICPARLDPSMLTSYAEFGHYDEAEAKGLDVCFECGLCGYVCIARRPMLQFIRLAKEERSEAEHARNENIEKPEKPEKEDVA